MAFLYLQLNEVSFLAWIHIVYILYIFSKNSNISDGWRILTAINNEQLH